VFEYERDTDDAHYIDLAVACRAKLIVSRDRDLRATRTIRAQPNFNVGFQESRY
jgi:predicted nucleic acid-binding protein